MEELNIEQKAKRYDEILARAKYANMPHNMKEFVDYLIPELKEGGDERIRKKLISYFSNIQGFSSLEYNYGITKEEVVAWLEKQGEQKPTWSEEDYDEMGVIACHLDNMGNEAMANSLLCFRDKYNNAQPKQVWSEEDKNMIENIFETIDAYYYLIPNYKEKLSWLNSLMQRMKGE